MWFLIFDVDDPPSNVHLSGGFIENFIILNIINFVDMVRREKNEIL